LSIEICIINPYESAISNEKIKLCAQKVIDKNSSIFINSKNSQVDYFELHSETINISKLIRAVEKNNSSDAFIIVSFEDIGVDTIRKITSKPIIGLGEAAFYTANIIANKFSVITNLSHSHEALKNNLIKYDMDHKCVSINSIEVPILDMETMSKSNLNKLENEIQRTITEDDPEVLIITSPGILNLSKNLSNKFNIPIIEGVTAATALMENFSKLDLQIKKFVSKPNRNFGIPI
jgi:allantoin racemase